jgi:DNA-binding CsgD family transcriptional regulator
MNARAELHLMNFFGNINALDLRQSEMANFHEVSNRGYYFRHFGYAYRAMWAEVWPPHHVQELQNQGMQIERQMTLLTGETSTLMCLTPERALANPYARRSRLFFPPAPRFRFSLGEQSVLEWTMLGLPDDEIAEKVHVSMDAIKKRWRSIYAKVESVDPGLLTSADSGTAQRRELLSYLEVHLEEIRPYSC